jgi:hypothetical protein
MFRFSPEQIDWIAETLTARIGLLEELFPWENANFGLDERWAGFYPYGQSVEPGDTAEQELRIWNHSDRVLQGEVKLNPPNGWTITPRTANFRIGPRQEGTIFCEVKSSGKAAPGAYVLTADIDFNGWQLKEWTEGLVVMEKP